MVLNKYHSIIEHIRRNSVMGVGAYVVWSQLTIYEIGSSDKGASVLVTVPGALYISITALPERFLYGPSLPMDLLKIPGC